MKKLLTGILSFLCLFTLTSVSETKVQASEESVTVLRVATYNIASKNTPKVENFVDQFAKYDIDIAGVQEVDMNNKRNDYDMMAAFAGEEYPYTDFGKGRDYEGGDFGVGIVSRYAFLNTQNIPMEGVGEATKAIERVEIEVEGKRIAIYNTHPSWETQELRRRQFRTLIETVQADPTPYKIITGDFNADQSLYEFTMFLDDFYIANGANGQWFDTYNEDDDPNMKVDTIDNIIVSKNIRITEVDMVENKLSDHNMLYAQLELLDEAPQSGEGNIALGQAVSVTGDQSTDPLKMVDYDETSSYALADGQSALLTLDKPYALTGLAVQWQGAPAQCRLEYSSDGSAWTTVYEGDGAALVSLSDAKAQYVRLTALSAGEVCELKAIGTPAAQTKDASSVMINGGFEELESAPTQQLGPNNTYWDVGLWANDQKPQNWNLQIYDGTGDPTLYQGSVDTVDKIEGNQSVVITKDDTSAHQAFFKQMKSPAQGATTYTLSFWIKSDDLQEDELVLSVSQYNASQKEISGTNIVYKDILSKQGEWIHYMKQITTHSNTAYMDFVFKIGNNADGSFHLDDMRMETSNPAAAIKVNGDAQMTIGESQTLALDILPDDADAQSYVWTSSDEDLIRVDEAGNVTALRAGSAYVQAKAAANSRLYASLRIDVHADFTALQAQADIAAQLRQGSCTPRVWEAFTKAYAQANAVLSDPCADEAKVETAALSLQQAIADVEHSSAYNDLSALCAQLESLKKAQYESESWDVMASLWEEAKALLAQDDAQTDALITMKADLQKAVDSLQAVQDSTSKDEGTDQEQTPPKEDETGGEVPKPPVQEGERLPQDTQQTQTPDVQTNPQETSADTAAIEMKDCWWVGALVGAGALSLLTLRRRTHR